MTDKFPYAIYYTESKSLYVIRWATSEKQARKDFIKSSGYAPARVRVMSCTWNIETETFEPKEQQ
jgi:hypothetical protein